MSETPTPTRMMVLHVTPVTDDPDRAHHHWNRALPSFEASIPGAVSHDVGRCSVRVRGPARYYGGEECAAAAWLTVASQQGFLHAHVGIADGFFAATQAAVAAATRSTGMHRPEIHSGNEEAHGTETGIRIIASSDTASFLATLPVEVAAPPELTEVLIGLGIHTLGQLAALPAAAIHERFGDAGLEAHRLARGLMPRKPVDSGRSDVFVEHRSTLHLESPLDSSEQLTFASRAHSDTFLHTLAKQGHICTELRIELIDDNDTSHARNWAHPTHFTPADILNRIRWQAAEVPRNLEHSGAGISAVTLIAVRVARAAEHEPGLWNTAPDERIHHHVTRVQHLLGYDGVRIGALSGGRLSSDRQSLLPWGSSTPLSSLPADLPWPGHIPGDPPSQVYPAAPPASLWDRNNQAISVDHDDFLTADPAFFVAGIAPMRHGIPVQAWSKPWPVNEQWWIDAHSSGIQHRLQLLLTDGSAWLLRYQRSTEQWCIEARYD